MSYEMLSRGAASVHAVDIHHACIAFIKKTAAALDFEITTTKSDVFEFLKKHNGSYDLIFADPPYAFEEEEFLQIPNYIFDRKLLNPGGMLIIEHSKHTDLSAHSHFDNARRYGGTVFTFFLMADEEE
jgi:16S rRNA G966 N2-methylase RsmD